MLPEQRHKFILSYLEKQESISVQNLISKCNVSKITARRDLSLLENKGLLLRTHGGAVRADRTFGIFDFNNKANQKIEQKLEIGRLASTYIRENETIYMDCGTTVYFMCRFLSKFRNLRVITNSLPVVSELMPFNNIKVYLIGGELDNSRKALYGSMTETILERYKADKAFIGAGGVSLKSGLSSEDEKDASITRKMAEAATEVFLLCDSSKLEKDSYFNYSSLSLVSCLITDKNAPTNIIERYRENNINIITAI
jgi:DeoR family fructose operon transcriptional repressor